MQLLEGEEDKIKFEQLYGKYERLTFYVARKYLDSVQDCEDAVYQSFLYIAGNFPKIPRVDCPQTKVYIVAVVRSRAVVILRKNAKRSGGDIDELKPAFDLPLPGDGHWRTHRQKSLKGTGI